VLGGSSFNTAAGAGGHGQGRPVSAMQRLQLVFAGVQRAIVAYQVGRAFQKRPW
jgi:hypothetical protein